MASSVKRCIRVLAAAVALAIPSFAIAGTNDTSASNTYSLLPVSDAPATSAGQSSDAASADPLLADAAAEPAPEKPNIHGFFNSPFKTAYVTPRGLVVQNAGLVWQPVVGLVFP